jgi:hypothetical protein
VSHRHRNLIRSKVAGPRKVDTSSEKWWSSWDACWESLKRRERVMLFLNQFRYDARLRVNEGWIRV